MNGALKPWRTNWEVPGGDAGNLSPYREIHNHMKILHLSGKTAVSPVGAENILL
jgi:hypothetical protein